MQELGSHFLAVRIVGLGMHQSWVQYSDWFQHQSLQDNFEFVFSTRYKKPGGSDDDTFLTFIGNYFFTFLCKILFRLNISDVLYTYVMGKTTAFQDLDLKYNDFTFCIELPIKAKFKSLRMFDFPSYERPRISGKKKVNELRDGFLILISILRLFIFKKWKK